MDPIEADFDFNPNDARGAAAVVDWHPRVDPLRLVRPDGVGLSVFRHPRGVSARCSADRSGRRHCIAMRDAALV